MSLREGAVRNPEALWGRRELLGNWRWENTALYFPKGREKVWFWKLDTDVLLRF